MTPLWVLALAATLPPVVWHAVVQSTGDGDTFTASIRPWPQPKTTFAPLVRVRGIDAPELRGQCPEEIVAAQRAQAVLRATVPVGSTVALRRPSPDLYAGRVDADVTLPDGRDLAAVLIAAGVVRVHRGSSKRTSWCAEGVAHGE
jgi:micrococcal nuclease